AWRTDADGRLSQISPEFALAVGAEAATVEGRRFDELANELGLEPGDEVARLLSRRDTWSGRTVSWPVAGTDLRIPVDLAALPIYDRNRDFQGFRGFGVARTDDAVFDPQRTGLALTRKRQEEADDAAENPALDKIIQLAEHRAAAPERQPSGNDQPAANEKTLTSGERLAFQQIAERLK